MSIENAFRSISGGSVPCIQGIFRRHTYPHGITGFYQSIGSTCALGKIWRPLNPFLVMVCGAFLTPEILRPCIEVSSIYYGTLISKFPEVEKTEPWIPHTGTVQQSIYIHVYIYIYSAFEIPELRGVARNQTSHCTCIPVMEIISLNQLYSAYNILTTQICNGTGSLNLYNPIYIYKP